MSEFEFIEEGLDADILEFRQRTEISYQLKRIADALEKMVK